MIDDAFLRAVVADPDDVALRLVYADWLEEREDPRGEYLRLLLALDAADLTTIEDHELRARLRTHRTEIDLHWIAQVQHCRKQRRRQRGKAAHGPARRRNSPPQEMLESHIAIFLRRYARKAQSGADPNDRHYDRKVEELVKRLAPEDLDRLMRSESLPAGQSARSRTD